MRNINILITFLFSIVISAQDTTEINSDLKLSDSLTNKTEIRIYQGGGISNYSSLFRMYQIKRNKWIVEFYEHFSKVNSRTELHIKKRELKSRSDMEFVYLNLIRSNILNLPNQQEIRWKLSGRDSIQKVKREFKGKDKEEYESFSKTTHIVDGIGYRIQVKDHDRKNDIYYSNPKSYLEEYPEVDELIFICEILDIIKNEFGIWKNN